MTTQIDYPNCAVKYISSDLANSIEINPTNIIVNTNAGIANQLLAKNASNELDWLDIEPPVTIINYFISQTNPLFQYPPQPPSSTIINTYGYYGWQFINAIALRKISWYFAPDYDMEVQDVLGLYMNYFNVASTSNGDLPFITIYTKPLGSGDILPTFAHSSMTYVPNFTPVVNSPYSSFMNITGVQPTPFAYGHQQVGMIQSPVAPNPNGTYTPTMKVLAIAVGSNSTSPVNSVNFVMSKVGVCVAGVNNESVLNPLDSTLVGTWVNTATSNLNMSSFSINNVSSLNAISATDLNITGQAVFDTPPHMPEPILGNDGATKGYVDSLVGQYGGSLNLFMNYSVFASPPPNGYKELSPTITTATATEVTTTANGTEQLVASFITAPLNLDSLPAGVWIGNINGKTFDKNVAVAYVMRIYKYTIGNVETQIGTGATSTSINTLAFGDYYCNLVVPTTVLAITDRLVVKIFVLKTGSGSNPTITTAFEGQYYSYVSSSLNAGTTLLSSNNIWTGTNNFEALGLKTSTLDSSSGLSVGTETSTSLILGKSGNTTNIQGNLQIAGQSGTSGQFLQSSGAGSVPIWVTGSGGWVGTATSTLNMGIYDISGTIMDSLTTLSLGNTSATTTTLGRSAGTTAINGTTITLTGAVKSNNIDTATGVPLLIGNTTATSLTIGRTTINMTINAVTCAFSGIIQSIAGQLQTNAWNTINSASTAQMWASNLTGVCSILTGATRTAATNMLTGTSTNTFTIGSGTTGLSFVLNGLAATFNSATNSFSSIKGVGTTLNITTPIAPTSITYNAGGTNIAGSVGQIIKKSNSLQNVVNSTLVAITSMNTQITAGVWYISVMLIPYNPSTTIVTTYPRLVLNIGSGLTGNTNDDVATITDTNVVLGFTNAAGNQRCYTFGSMFSTNTSTFISCSVLANTPTTPLPLQFQGAQSILSITRIA
jgi:hypothetical protein